MTDKQPFRDKLVLPTQAVNVFLTSMTHVGLANVGMLMMRGGSLPLPPTGGSGLPGWGGQGTKGPPSIGGGHEGQGNTISEWDVEGRRIAFRDTEFIRTASSKR